MKSYKSIFIGGIFIITFLVATALTWLYSKVNDALPILEGKENLYGLVATVSVDRDQQGIPTIKGQSRTDVALASGFIHAQERFFQMDLLRRNSAGELSSLFGSAALDYDKSIRRHRFRERAREIVKYLPYEQYQILKAYTQGVNQGLEYLRSVPFEYLLLQQEPVVWQEEDSILTVLSMYLDLQYQDGQRERSLGLIKDLLGDDVYQFLNPKGSIWDAAIDETQFAEGRMPERAWPAVSALKAVAQKTAKPQIPNELISLLSSQNTQIELMPGSNNWAVAGQISATGSAMVANDMHLGIRVPNTWFRISIEYPKEDDTVKVTGVSLPGTPNIIVGSNKSVAWGFTNSYGDWSDVIILEVNEDGSQYNTPDGFKPFIESKQIIAIKGQEPEHIVIKDTIWGPVIGENHKGELLAYRWVAHDIQAVNMTQMEMELAESVDEAFDIAARSGIPAQNLMVADSLGNIGWTIMGPIPKKVGNIGDLPASWADGTNKWDGYLPVNKYPKVKNPEHHRLWTANSRVVGGEMYAKLGNGGYAVGARSKQIKENLFAKGKFAEQDLLDIALDDKANFLKRWQQFLLEKVLTTPELQANPNWQQAKEILTAEQELSASANSVAYRIVRNFRLNLRDNVFEPLIESLEKHDDTFSFRPIRHQIESPLWQLINQQPENFLMTPADSWQEVFATTLNQTLDEMTLEQPLAEATWGLQNTTQIRHPLSKAVPFIGNWLDMPAQQLAGDSYLPRVQGKTFGASERMVVSPGHEESGILHMPTSQSGHPWSPYYGLGHQDWVAGNPSPFLPGETKYSLALLSY